MYHTIHIARRMNEVSQLAPSCYIGPPWQCRAPADFKHGTRRRSLHGRRRRRRRLRRRRDRPRGPSRRGNNVVWSERRGVGGVVEGAVGLADGGKGLKT